MHLKADSSQVILSTCLQVEYKKRLAEGLGTENAPRILAFKNKV